MLLEAGDIRKGLQEAFFAFPAEGVRGRIGSPQWVRRVCVRGVSKNFPGLLLLFAACFEDEAKEPEAAASAKQAFTMGASVGL